VLQRRKAVFSPGCYFPEWEIPGIGRVRVITPTVFATERRGKEKGPAYMEQRRFRLMWRKRPVVYRAGATADGMFSEKDMIFAGC